MKPRSPLTLEGAFCRVKDILGAPLAARILDISESMVYKCCDAEHAASLKFSDAVALDKACREKTGETPLSDFYQQRIEETPRPDAAANLVNGVLKLNAELGAVNQEISDLLDPKTNAPRAMSNRKVIDLQAHLHTVAQCAENLEHAVSTTSKQ